MEERTFKCLLVTGGVGFIGCNFIKFMLGKYKDLKVVNLDKCVYPGSIGNLVLSNRHYFFCADINDGRILQQIGSDFKIDGIIHFAAETHVDTSIKNPGIFIKSNVLGTHNLLEFAREREIYFHYISTDEVYGSLGPHEPPFSEESPLHPSSPYSASKAAGEHLVWAYHVTYGLPITISRCTNNFGPFQQFEKLIPLVIKKCKERKRIPIYGDGQNRRDWIYVLDHCEALDLILHKAPIGSVYNVGAGNEWTNLDLVKLICSIVKTQYQRTEVESLITFVEDRPGHDFRYAVDTVKILHELGWMPSSDFEKQLSDTVTWYWERL